MTPQALAAALVLLIFLAGIYAEQAISATRSKFGLGLFNPLTVEMKLTNRVASRYKADQVVRDDDVSESGDKHITIKRLNTALKKGAVDVRKDLLGCYETVARAKNNFERMEHVLDMLVSHKRAIAVGILCTCGLLALYGPGPEK
jgi:hypothetical protein